MNDIGQFHTIILWYKMIAGKPITNVSNDSTLHAQTISIFPLRLLIDKAVTSTRDNPDGDFADILMGVLKLHGNNFGCQFVKQDFSQTDLLQTKFSSSHTFVHCIGDGRSENYSANGARLSAFGEVDPEIDSKVCSTIDTTEIDVTSQLHKIWSITGGNKQISNVNIQIHIDRYGKMMDNDMTRQLHEVGTVANDTRFSVFGKFGPKAITCHEVDPETFNHDDMTSGNSTKLDLDSILHDDLTVHTMRFIFTDSSRRLISFHSFSRSMRPTDCLFHISHGSCYNICIILTKSRLFINFNGACLLMLINGYQFSSNETDSDSKIGSQLSTKGPDVSPYEFDCYLHAMLDIGQNAVDQKKFNTKATDTRYNSNSSDETKCFDDDDITCSESHQPQTRVNTLVPAELEHAGANPDYISSVSKAFLHLMTAINLGDGYSSRHITISTGSRQCVRAPLCAIDNEKYDETNSMVRAVSAAERKAPGPNMWLQLLKLMSGRISPGLFMETESHSHTSVCISYSLGCSAISYNDTGNISIDVATPQILICSR